MENKFIYEGKYLKVYNNLSYFFCLISLLSLSEIFQKTFRLSYFVNKLQFVVKNKSHIDFHCLSSY